MIILEFEMNREPAEQAQHTPRRAPRAGEKKRKRRDRRKLLCIMV
jgi:hypothetical protein